MLGVIDSFVASENGSLWLISPSFLPYLKLRLLYQCLSARPLGCVSLMLWEVCLQSKEGMWDEIVQIRQKWTKLKCKQRGKGCRKAFVYICSISKLFCFLVLHLHQLFSKWVHVKPLPSIHMRVKMIFPVPLFSMANRISSQRLMLISFTSGVLPECCNTFC